MSDSITKPGTQVVHKLNRDVVMIIANEDDFQNIICHYWANGILQTVALHLAEIDLYDGVSFVPLPLN